MLRDGSLRACAQLLCGLVSERTQPPLDGQQISCVGDILAGLIAAEREQHAPPEQSVEAGEEGSGSGAGVGDEREEPASSPTAVTAELLAEEGVLERLLAEALPPPPRAGTFLLPREVGWRRAQHQRVPVRVKSMAGQV